MHINSRRGGGEGGDLCRFYGTIIRQGRELLVFSSGFEVQRFRGSGFRGYLVIILHPLNGER
jgi:hypothetical protein